MAVAATGVTTIDALPVAIFHRAVARSSWSSGCGERFWNGSTSRAGSATTASESAALVSSQKPRSTGTKSSTARLSFTTTTRGRSAFRRKSTSSKAFAVGDSPETRMRPVPSRRWEATRVKAGSISTSEKSSRTKGRSMLSNFNRVGLTAPGDGHFLVLEDSPSEQPEIWSTRCSRRCWISNSDLNRPLKNS